ncbi:MAG: hypothetical protein ACI82A_001381 [Candidatus Azotimanducaceae bacterium]|jgi:hypothetical protein
MQKYLSMLILPPQISRALSMLTICGLFLLASMPASATPPYSVVAPAGQHVCACKLTAPSFVAHHPFHSDICHPILWERLAHYLPVEVTPAE